MPSATASAIPRFRGGEDPVATAASASPLVLLKCNAHRRGGGGSGAARPSLTRRRRPRIHLAARGRGVCAQRPKIRQVVDWFGQLQAVHLEYIAPSLRAGTAASSSLREDKAETFANRDAIVEAIPSYDDPYIEVPRVLNKE